MKVGAKMRKKRLMMIMRRRNSANLKMVRGEPFGSMSSLSALFYHYSDLFPPRTVSHFVGSQVKWTGCEIRLEV